MNTQVRLTTLVIIVIDLISCYYNVNSDKNLTTSVRNNITEYNLTNNKLPSIPYTFIWKFYLQCQR